MSSRPCRDGPHDAVPHPHHRRHYARSAPRPQPVQRQWAVGSARPQLDAGPPRPVPDVLRAPHRPVDPTRRRERADRAVAGGRARRAPRGRHAVGPPAPHRLARRPRRRPPTALRDVLPRDGPLRRRRPPAVLGRLPVAEPEDHGGDLAQRPALRPGRAGDRGGSELSADVRRRRRLVRRRHAVSGGALR